MIPLGLLVEDGRWVSVWRWLYREGVAHYADHRVKQNGGDQRLADRGAFMPTDFIASPLHRLVLRPLNCRRRFVALLTLP